MANSTTTSPTGASIIPDGSTNWVLSDETNKHFVLLKRIQFNPSAAGDRLIIRDGGTAGRIIFDSDFIATQNDVVEVQYHGMKCVPFIGANDCTFSTPSDALIMMDWERTPF